MNDKNYNSYLQTVNSNSPARKGSPKKDNVGGGGNSTTKPQPRFIRKKPQVIQSIEFCKELKTSYIDEYQNTPSQAQTSPGKIQKPTSEDETHSQFRSSMIYHPQKGDDSSHHEVYDYDEELMHAQVPIIQEDHQQEVYRTYDMDDQSEHSERPQLYSKTPPSVIHEETEQKSVQNDHTEKTKQNMTGYTYSLNNMSQAMNIKDQYQQQPTSQGPNDLNVIKQMMENLKKKKQEELQQMMQVKPPFQLEPSEKTDSEYQSDPKVKNKTSYTSRSKQNREKLSPERYSPTLHQDIEDLKKKKIEEIKSKLIKEKSQGIIPYQAQEQLQEEYKTDQSNKYNSRDSSIKASAKNEQKNHQMITRPKTANPNTKQNFKVEEQEESKKIALKSAIQQKAQQQTRNFQSFKPSQFSTQSASYSKNISRNVLNKVEEIKQSGYDSKPSYLFTTIQPSEKSSMIPRKNSPRATSPIPIQAIKYAAHQTLDQIAPHLMLSTPQQQVQDSYRVQQHLTSEKTQQIVFKKLQKDVELAIRNEDHGEKGALNMEELKRCLHSLDYLGYMQVEEEEQLQQQHIRKLYNGQNHPRHHVTTKKSLVMQEKEFVYNFWCIINPLNQTEVDNALLYDILLLLIYNVQQSLHVTIGYLTDYLDNHYREQGIDLDSFANYNSGTSQGTGSSPDHPSQQTEQLSNVSKYLSYCNLWPIERLTFEFRQIHANKLSHQFSSNISKKRTSVSPIGIQGSQSQYNQTLVNPTDGRRYKKAVIQEHLSNLTFSPRISNKTKELDQRLTQKLLNNKQSPSIKRDFSADIIAQKASSHFTLNLEPIQQNSFIESGLSPSQVPNFKRYDLLLFRQQMTQQKIEKAKQSKQQKQLEECTFHPKLQNENSLISGSLTGGTLQSSKSYQNLQRQTNTVFREITEKVKTQRSKLLDHTEASKAMASHTAAILKDEKELEECTFKPKINPPLTQNRTPRRQENESIAANQVPKGYYQMVNRMRKVNEEKKALEDKIHKKVIGENYDKVKLMSLKPPSFVQGQGEKKKRKLLMYIDVNITPTRTGRIGIYEGDDVRELARNFQKTFQLNNNMFVLLTQQLEQHLQIYKERNGLSDIQGTTFPPEQEDGKSNQDQLGPPQGFYFNGQQSIEGSNGLNQMIQDEELKSNSDMIRPEQFQNMKFVPQTSQKDGNSIFSPLNNGNDSQIQKRTHYNQHSNPIFFVQDDDSPRQGFQTSGIDSRDDFQRYSQRAQAMNGAPLTGGHRTGENSSKVQDSLGTSSDRTRIAGPDQPGFFGIPLNEINIQQLTQRNTLQNANIVARNETFY